MRKAVLHIEGVPNPDAMKFVLDNGILSDEPYEYIGFESAGSSPLARKLLLFRYVERVLIHRNYITVRKHPGSGPEWSAILPELRQLIQDHLDQNEPIIYLGGSRLQHQRPDDVVLELIQQVLDRQIRPAAQEDGGDILIESYEDGVLNLSMHGSCHACPFAAQTMRQGVEPLVHSIAPEVKRVISTGNRLL
jgi:Fe-S cluster biogenesis protein NfuA